MNRRPLQNTPTVDSPGERGLAIAVLKAAVRDIRSPSRLKSNVGDHPMTRPYNARKWALESEWFRFWCHAAGLNPESLRDGLAEVTVHGADRPGAKLTERKVRWIRKARAAGFPIARLAERFDICQSRISKVARGLAWRHV